MKESTLKKLRELRNEYRLKANSLESFSEFYNEGIADGISKAMLLIIDNEEEIELDDR